MGDARGQHPQRGHLLGVHQPALAAGHPVLEDGVQRHELGALAFEARALDLGGVGPLPSAIELTVDRGVCALVIQRLDLGLEHLDRLLAGWQQTLIDNLDDPIIQANFELLKASQRELIKTFLASKTLPDPVPPDFVAAVQEALSGLEKIVVTSDDIKKALITGGSPATPEDLRKRFEALLNERCKGKDASKLRFVVE